MAEKILVEEDEFTLQETLAYNLKHQEYKVETTNDGQTSINKRLHFLQMNSSIAYALVSKRKHTFYTELDDFTIQLIIS